MPGLLTHPVNRIVAQLIVDLGYGVEPNVRNPAAWSVYYAGEPPDPDEVITVRSTEGLDDGTTQFDGVLQEWYGLQVRVRSTNEDGGWAKINPLAVTLHALSNQLVTVDGTQYLVASVGLRGGPTSLTKGDPASSRSIHVLNALASIDQD